MQRRHGAEVTYLLVNADGLVDPDELDAALTDRTVLVSIMAANETGALKPIPELIGITHGQPPKP